MTTPQEIQFTNAFNATKPTLALFSKCNNKDELHVLRDSLFLGMGSLLCTQEYNDLREQMIIDPVSHTAISNSIDSPNGLESMITAARTCDGWESLLAALLQVSTSVGSDLDSIWNTLEDGRLQWLGALNSAHTIKATLKDALDKDANKTEKDIVDAKMIYIYALALSIPSLNEAVEAWCKIVKMNDKTQPLKNYNAELWDCRREEWRPLDLGVQEAAERGGSSFIDTWEA